MCGDSVVVPGPAPRSGEHRGVEQRRGFFDRWFYAIAALVVLATLGLLFLLRDFSMA
jgi:hypothetical protein